LLDESGANADSESLDLEDDDPKVADQAPKVLPHDTANGAAESPYSGLKIAPNEAEMEFVSSRPNLEPVDELAPPDEKTAPANRAGKGPEVAKIELKDDDDDDDDLLTLSDSEPRKHADAAVEKTEKAPEKAAEKPLAPAPLSGLKGICPVVLKDNRKLLDAQPDIKSEFRGKTYTFSSIEAKKAFDENPRKYAPAGGGNDVVRLTAGEADVAGTLEHAAWYRGRLYLFSTDDSRHEFVETPSKFVVED
jgi:YHS domain-containing protein